MTQLIIRVLLAASLATSLPAFAQSLIGDTLSFNRRYPTTGTPYVGWSVPSRSTTVASGSGDLIDWYSNGGTSGFHLTVNPEATTITFNLLSGSSFITSGSQFDGFTITGFSKDISFVNVASNGTGLILTLSNTAREIQIGLAGNNSFNAFTLNVGTVPEPQTWALFGIGLAFVARKFGRRQIA